MTKAAGMTPEIAAKAALDPQNFALANCIRALAIDKDNAPRWHPARIEDVTPDMVEPFFASPWPAAVHPLASLA